MHHIREVIQMNIKKVVALLIVSLLLTSCGGVESEYSEYKGAPLYFKVISNEGCGRVVYDTRTGVEYWESYGAYNGGTLTLLVDAEGKPLIYEGEQRWQ